MWFAQEEKRNSCCARTTYTGKPKQLNSLLKGSISFAETVDRRTSTEGISETMYSSDGERECCE